MRANGLRIVRVERSRPPAGWAWQRRLEGPAGGEMVGWAGSCRVKDGSMPILEPPAGTAIASREVNLEEVLGWRLPIPDDPSQWPCGGPKRVSTMLTGSS